jgi:DNA-3-methyladenine glycosylase II
MESIRPQITISAEQPFDFGLSLAYFRRRAGELVDATEGESYRRLLSLRGRSILVEATAAGDDTAPGLNVKLLIGDPALLQEAALALRRAFGLDDDLAGFRREVCHDPVLTTLLDKLRGLRLVRTQSAFEALVWAVIGQQINLTFAFRLKSQLVRDYGDSVEFKGRSYWAFPLPERLAGVELSALASGGLSSRKAATIVDVARRISSGALDLEALAGLERMESEQLLVGIPGVGPWTAHYVLLRGLGDFGAFPASDLGLRVAVGSFYGSDRAAPLSQMKELAARWGDWRGYAAFYLWNALAARGA